MALVVFLKGVNVGGHRTFRPTALARELERLGAINVGAAGTLVVTRTIAKAALRAELSRRLPFQADVMICDGRDILRVLAANPAASMRPRPGIVPFVSILSRRPVANPPMPLVLPSRSGWFVKLLAIDGRFVVGLYRRHMKTIGYLAGLDRLFQARVTTRNLSTMTAVARLLTDPTRERKTARRSSVTGHQSVSAIRRRLSRP